MSLSARPRTALLLLPSRQWSPVLSLTSCSCLNVRPGRENCLLHWQLHPRLWLMWITNNLMLRLANPVLILISLWKHILYPRLDPNQRWVPKPFTHRESYQSNQARAPTTQLDPISSCKEFDIQDIEFIEDNADLSDSPQAGPSNDPPDPVPQRVPNNPAPKFSWPSSHSTLDILHFFTKIEFPTTTNEKERFQKVCNLCMCIWAFWTNSHILTNQQESSWHR
jgi:hypothetical protein